MHTYAHTYAEQQKQAEIRLSEQFPALEIHSLIAKIMNGIMKTSPKLFISNAIPATTWRMCNMPSINK